MDKFAIFFTFNPNTFNKVIRAPYIGDNYFQNKKDVTGSGFVFDKIYSRSLIIRAANYIGPEIWNQNLVYIDDLLLCYAAMKNAKTIILIKVFIRLPPFEVDLYNSLCRSHFQYDHPDHYLQINTYLTILPQTCPFFN